MAVTRRAHAGLLACAAASSVVASSVVAACVGEDDRAQEAPRPATAGSAELPEGVRLREPDGSYPAGLPNDESFFPLGVWFETVVDEAELARDRSFGVNLYVALAAEEQTPLDAIEASGMHLLVQADEWLDDPRAGHPAIDGWVVYDEADLTYRAGWDDWSGSPGWNTCEPIQDEGGRCGYTVMQHFSDRVPAGMLRYANYGLDVLEFETDAEARVFVNGGFQDVVSADDYAFTHPDAADGERRGASYGAVVERIRALDRHDDTRQPVWAFVELGHPFTDESAPTITADQVRSAVWHSIIAGARGIVYFNHSFGGSCPTFSVLREGCDPEMAPAVTELNAELRELAPVLNAPFADGYVSADGPAEVTAKLGPDGAWYVFAGATTRGSAGGEVTFSVAAGSEVEVLHEGRELAVTDGRFTDTFADGNAVHIYRVR